MVAIKVALLILAVLLSVIVYAFAYAIVKSYAYKVKAVGLPWMLNDPLFWLFMILLIGGEIWIGVNKLARR